MTKPMSKVDWQIAESRRFAAGKRADEIVARLLLNGRIEPLEIAQTERSHLRWRGDNFGTAFDGKLLYAPEKHRFMMLFNTKYDEVPGDHHPRTRFSISHELGHYYLDEHNAFLKHGGAPHDSKGEFRNANDREKEADAFAASLLLPTHLVEPIISVREVTLGMISKLARDFGVSELTAAFRCIRLSDRPCGLAGIVEGGIAWTFCSERLIDAGCFPGKKSLTSEGAKHRWGRFMKGEDVKGEQDGYLRDWLQLFSRADELCEVEVTESFIPVPAMGTLAVVLTMDESDILGNEDDQDDEYDHFDKFRHDSGD